MLLLLVNTRFQILFTPLAGVLFTFPSRYSFTIDHVTYLALEGGPPRFSQGFTCPDLLKKTHMISNFIFKYEAFTLFGQAFQLVLLTKQLKSSVYLVVNLTNKNSLE